MKVLVMIGSRNHDGQTAKVANAYIEGLKDGDAAVEHVYLPEMKINRCLQCNKDGWGTCLSDGKCCQTDDFSSLVDKVRAADAVVFATPVYWGDLSESLKAFLDRLRRICTSKEEGRNGIRGKTAVGIAVAGGGGGGSLNCIENLQRTCDHMGINVVDMIPSRRQNLDLKIEVARLSGKWLALQRAQG